MGIALKLGRESPRGLLEDEGRRAILRQGGRKSQKHVLLHGEQPLCPRVLAEPAWELKPLGRPVRPVPTQPHADAPNLLFFLSFFASFSTRLHPLLLNTLHRLALWHDLGSIPSRRGRNAKGRGAVLRVSKKIFVWRLKGEGTNTLSQTMIMF